MHPESPKPTPKWIVPAIAGTILLLAGILVGVALGGGGDGSQELQSVSTSTVPEPTTTAVTTTEVPTTTTAAPLVVPVTTAPPRTTVARPAPTAPPQTAPPVTDPPAPPTTVPLSPTTTFDVYKCSVRVDYGPQSATSYLTVVFASVSGAIGAKFTLDFQGATGHWTYSGVTDNQAIARVSLRNQTAPGDEVTVVGSYDYPYGGRCVTKYSVPR